VLVSSSVFNSSPDFAEVTWFGGILVVFITFAVIISIGLTIKQVRKTKVRVVSHTITAPTQELPNATPEF
jgi:hypothetical protein